MGDCDLVTWDSVTGVKMLQKFLSEKNAGNVRRKWRP